MKLRSITCLYDPQHTSTLDGLAAFTRAAREAFTAAGYEVQTTRLAATPFPRWLPLEAPGAAERRALELERAARLAGFDYLALGPALANSPASFERIPGLLAVTRSVFFSGQIAARPSGVSLAAVRLAAEVIHAAAGLEPDGFANLRFAASANLPPGAPFFPAAYHAGGPPAFALALQAADLAVEAFGEAASLAEAAERLIAQVESHARRLARLARRLSRTFGLRFGGLDFSPAPFPLPELSLGAALERLGLPALGLHGSLAAAAFLANALDTARFRRAGFSGLMLPVLEDAILAQRAAGGSLGVKDLLLYSAVCGTGLDTVPLPGDVSVEALAAVLVDVGALALRLDKPLTARLMPIPGKAAGDPTGFDFAFFANSRVLPLEAAPLQGLLAGSEAFNLNRRG